MADTCDDRSNIVTADFLNRIMTDFSGDNVSRDSVTTTITRPRVLSRELAKGGWLGFDSRHKQKLLPFDTTSSLASYSTGTGISPRHFDSSLTIAFSPPSRTKLKNASNFTSTPLHTFHLTCDDNFSDVTIVLELNYQITENWSAVRNHLSFSKNSPHPPHPHPTPTSVRNHCYWKFFVERFKLGREKKEQKTTVSVLALFTPVYLHETMTYRMSTNSVLYNAHRITLGTAALSCHLCNTQISRYNYTLFPKFVQAIVISGYRAPSQYTLPKHFLGKQSGIISI